MAVKVMQLEDLLQDKQAALQKMGDTGQAWVEDACRLRDAVASTLAAMGKVSLTVACSQEKILGHTDLQVLMTSTKKVKIL